MSMQERNGDLIAMLECEFGRVVSAGAGGASEGHGGSGAMTVHDIIGALHTVAGRYGLVVGTVADNTLGLLDINDFLKLWLGRSDGLRLGLWTNPDGVLMLGMVDTDGVPVFSLTGRDGVPGSVEAQFGWSDKPHIYLEEAPAGAGAEVHRRVVVDNQCLREPVSEKRMLVWHFYGSLAVGEHEAPIVNRFGSAATLVGVYIHVKAGNEPGGAAIIADLHAAGTTVFTTQANRPQIADGGTAGDSTTIENAIWAAGAELLPFVDQVGSVAPGSGLVMEVVFTA